MAWGVLDTTFLRSHLRQTNYVTIIKFTVILFVCLEQLLNIAVCQVNPDFGERRKNLLKDREELEEKEANLQNQLLNDLIDSTGNILMDTVSKRNISTVYNVSYFHYLFLFSRYRSIY